MSCSMWRAEAVRLFSSHQQPRVLERLVYWYCNNFTSCLQEKAEEYLL